MPRGRVLGDGAWAGLNAGTGSPVRVAEVIDSLVDAGSSLGARQHSSRPSVKSISANLLTCYPLNANVTYLPFTVGRAA